MEADFQVIHTALQGTTLPEAVEYNVTWSVQQLPPLYEGLCQTGESRFANEIQRLVQGMVNSLKDAKDCPEAPGLATLITDQLRDMHERLGLGELELKKPAAPKKSKPRKAT